MKHKAMYPFVLPVLLLLLSTARPLAADLIVGTHYNGFVDVNGNGRLDCGEPVTILAAWSTNGFVTKGLSGTLTLPGTGSQGLLFEPGSVEIVPDLSVGCDETIVSGNNPGDFEARVQFVCDPSKPNPQGQTAFVIQYRALYFNSSFPGFVSAATVTTPDAGTFTKTEPQSVASSSCTGSPDTLKITKTESGTAAPGSTIVYTLTVTDSGTFGAGGLQLVDVVPDHTSFDPAASSPDWLCMPDNHAGSTCRNPVGNLNPGASLSRLFAVKIDDPLPAGVHALNNTGCVREGLTQVDGCSSVMTPTAGLARLTLAKALASGTGTPGATLVYSISAQNTGNEGATNVVFSEVVPQNTAFVAASSSPGWTCVPGAGAGSTCTLSIGTLAAGASTARNFALAVADPLPAGTAQIANTACAKSPDSQDGCHQVMVPTDGKPTLNLTKSLVSSSGSPGDTLVYDLALQNTGNEGASSTSLTETVPQGTTFAAGASSPGWSCAPNTTAGATCSLALGDLAAGSIVHSHFAVTILNPLPAGITSILNTACAAAPGTASSCATLPVTPKASPVLSLKKTYSGGPIHAGDHIAFTLTLSNTGNQDSTAVTLLDAIPAHVTFDAAGSSAGWACDPNDAPPSVCTLDAGNLAAGKSVTATIGFLVDKPLPPGVSQIANAACAQDFPQEAKNDPGAPQRFASGCSDTTTPASATVDSSLADTLLDDKNGNGMADPGDTIGYKLVVANTSQTAAAALAIVTHLDSNLTLIEGSVTTTAGTVTLGNTASDKVPTVTLASLAPGNSVTITFAAQITALLPATVTRVSSQAFTSGSNFSVDASDDPKTADVDDDPTVTKLHAGLIADVPTLGGAGLALLATALFVIAIRRLRKPLLTAEGS